MRDHLPRQGISPVIPRLKTEMAPRLMDRGLYRERNVVERLVGRPKEHRRVASRCDKLAAGCLALSGSPRSRSGSEGRVFSLGDKFLVVHGSSHQVVGGNAAKAGARPTGFGRPRPRAS